MRQYQKIEREETTVNGQRRVFARVGAGEILVVKVKQDTTESEIEVIVNDLIAAEEVILEQKPSVEELQAQIAELQAQLNAVGGNG